MNTRWDHWKSFFLLAFIVGGGYWSLGVPDTSASQNYPDQPGCDGLNVYMDDVGRIRYSYVDQMNELEPEALNPHIDHQWTDDDFVWMAAIAHDIAEQYAALTSPEWAAEWHQAQIDYWKISEEAGMAQALHQPTEEIAKKVEANRSAMILGGALAQRICSEFPYFVIIMDSIDGWDNGEPVIPMYGRPDDE